MRTPLLPRTLTAGIGIALAAIAFAQAARGTRTETPRAVRPMAATTQLTTADPVYRASATSPFTAGCDGVPADGTLYVNSEVEPYVAVDPTNANHVVAVWQQDRWSSGGARGLMSATSNDGGKTWQRTPLPFSRCAGGNATIGGNYARTSDPWVSIGPSGIVHTISISFEGNNSAVLASRSLDGGQSWSRPSTLILDGASFFNDKEAITADPKDANYVYAVWDRLPSGGGGPAMFARSINGGQSWQLAKKIYDPGVASQTIGNEIVVLPSGVLVDLFTQLNPDGSAEARVVRSSDKGTTWSASFKVADLLPVGAVDPENGTGVRDGAALPQAAVGPYGGIYVVWADGRFSGGVRDGIALSRSGNGGQTWTAPVQINGDPNAEAFEPSVHVRSDGTVSVSYFDFRNNTTAATLPTIVWLARSRDAITWHEAAVAGPFDLAAAPNAGGLFVGDYQGLSSMGNVFEPFFVRSNGSNTANRTDAFSAPAVSFAAMVETLRRAIGITAREAAPYTMTPAFRQRVAATLAKVVERREVQWRDAIRRREGKPPQR